MKKIYPLILIFLIIYISGCKKTNEKVLNISDTPSYIRSYISTSASTDSITYLFSYDNNNKIRHIDENPYSLFPPGYLEYSQNSDGSFNFISGNNSGTPYTIRYYTDANKRVTLLKDSIFNVAYKFNYNSSGYLENIVKSKFNSLNDSITYAYYYYDISNNLTEIEVYSRSNLDSLWTGSSSIYIERTSHAFPVKAYSTFSFGRPYLYSYYLNIYQPLLFTFQTSDIVFNFGKPQQFLPAVFSNTSSDLSNNTIVDSFFYHIDNTNRVSECTDHRNLITSSGTNPINIFRDTIIY